MSKWKIRILEEAEDIYKIEDLQRVIWPGSETDIVPAHIILTFAHNGGVVIGAFVDSRLIGFVYGFLGFTPNHGSVKVKHCSHQLGVLPDFRGQGVGFDLKRAQWQMVRHQGLDLITWTYDPLLSRNGYLNIAKLGAVCNIYLKDWYGEMRDGLNVGQPSDRFLVNWWVNSDRVKRRLSNQPRRRLDLAHFLSAGAEIINPTEVDKRGWPVPPTHITPFSDETITETGQIRYGERGEQGNEEDAVILVEVPSDYLALKVDDSELAREWRYHSRDLFADLFAHNYIVTDFVHLPGKQPRSFYVLSHEYQTF